MIRQHILHFVSMIQFSLISIEIKKICRFKGKSTLETSRSAITVFRIIRVEPKYDASDLTRNMKYSNILCDFNDNAGIF